MTPKPTLDANIASTPIRVVVVTMDSKARRNTERFANERGLATIPAHTLY